MNCIHNLLPTMGILLAVSIAGCGGSDRQPVYPVRGTVTFEGRSMPGGGSIAFVPLNRQKGKTAGGEIRENGEYELMTYAPGDGSMVGEFRVVITQAMVIEPSSAPQDGEKVPEGGMPGITVAPEDRIPAGYGDSQKSPLRATVEAIKNNEINFDLKRKLDDAEAPPAGVARREFPVELRIQRVPARTRNPGHSSTAGIAPGSMLGMR